MKFQLPNIRRSLVISILLSPAFLCAQWTSPGTVVESPETLVVRPDLDGDTIPDLVVVDRSTGIIRPALWDGNFTWLEPVQGGIAGVTGLASGPIEDPGFTSIALTDEAANRINLFSLSGSTLNRVPRSAFTDIFGLRELAALQEGSVPATTLEMVGFSSVFAPTDPGFRDFIGLDGGGLQSYDPGHAPPTFAERDYRRVLVELGIPPMLAYFEEETQPGEDRFNLVFLEDGNFELVAQVDVPSGAKMIHASFDRSDTFQYVFHVPGSDQLLGFFWDGGGLSQVGSFTLDEPASRIDPFVNDDVSGILARAMDGMSLSFYSFNGFDPPGLDDVIAPSSGETVGPAISFEDGTLLVLSGDPTTDPAAFAERFANSGGGFNSQGGTGIPALESIAAGSNVLLFSDTPFVSTGARLTGRLNAGVWTSAVAVGANVEAKVESYGGTPTGLHDPVTVVLGSTPADTAAGLPNQVDADISLYDRTPAAGALAGSITPVPAPGNFSESVSVSFFPSDPGMDVFYRVLPDGNWINSTGPAGPFFQDVALQVFGIAGDGRRSPLGTAAYSISVPPSALDSDKDGVPDYVEIANNLDPVQSEDDADDDGYSDLIELLAGTDPGDPLDTPPSRETDSDGDGFSDMEEAIAGTDPTLASSKPANPGVLNFQNVFDLLAVPYSHDGSTAANPFVPSLDEGLEAPGSDPLATNVRLYDPAASLVGFDRTALHGLGGVTDPAAYIEEVATTSPEIPMVVATERTFNIDVAGPDRRLGRQTAALLSVPEVSVDPVPYSFGDAGGATTAEAAAWVTAARNHFLSIDRPRIVREFDVFDTLVLLLVELKIEQILAARGLLNADSITLTGFRPVESPVTLENAPGDGSRSVIVPRQVLGDLRHKVSGSDTGFKVSRIQEVIETAVQAAGTSSISDLRSVAAEIYRISAATANDNPGTLVAPLDALRQFIRTGSLLNTGYLENPAVSPLDPVTLASASSGISALIALNTMRPVDFRQLQLSSGLAANACTILEDTNSSESVALIDFQGNPYPLPDAFSLPEGTVLIAEGYVDVDANCPADVVMEIIPPLQLVSLPVTATADSNGNLIPDDLEDLYPASLDPFADSDGDGFSDLEETLTGTHPVDSGDVPSGSPADLTPPAVTITDSGTGFFTFSFQFPALYADQISFRLFSGSDLQAMGTDSGFDAAHTGGGHHELIISKPGSFPVFYRFLMYLD